MLASALANCARGRPPDLTSRCLRSRGPANQAHRLSLSRANRTVGRDPGLLALLEVAVRGRPSLGRGRSTAHAQSAGVWEGRAREGQLVGHVCGAFPNPPFRVSLSPWVHRSCTPSGAPPRS